jgi:hypothetical protein
MKKFAVLIALLLCASMAAAQSRTAVSGTIKDAQGIPYSMSSVSLKLTPNVTGTPTVAGVKISSTALASTNINGTFQINLYPNASITPGGTQWQFTVCNKGGIAPPLGTGGKCFVVAITIAGASQDVSVTLSAAAPAQLSVSFVSATTIVYDNSATPYAAASSFQPAAADLTLAAGAGKDHPNTAFLAPVMGNIHGTGLTKTGDYLAGVIGAYDLHGSGASHYPKAGVLGMVMDGTTDANGAVVAELDGDSTVTTADAAYAVRFKNTVPGSHFSFGLDLSCVTQDGYPACVYPSGDIRLASGVLVLSGAVDPSAGAGVAAPQGSLYLRTNGGAGTTLYVKEGAADTNWAGK